MSPPDGRGAMPGPAPSPHALRRNARPDWRKLPAGGRTGRTPTWPLSEELLPPTLWAELWHTPQAVAWEELGWSRVVARYACLLDAVENPADGKPNAALLAEVRQLEDRLGLSPMAMRRLQWEVEAAPKGAGAAGVTNLDDYRSL